jgi:hypothetical protein
MKLKFYCYLNYHKHHSEKWTKKNYSFKKHVKAAANDTQFKMSMNLWFFTCICSIQKKTKNKWNNNHNNNNNNKRKDMKHHYHHI